MSSFANLKSLPNGEIILLFTDIGKSCIVNIFFLCRKCLLTLFAKISEFTVYHRHQNLMNWLKYELWHGLYGPQREKPIFGFSNLHTKTNLLS